MSTLDWYECGQSGYERSGAYYVGDDGMQGAPVFAERQEYGRDIVLYRGHDIERAKLACEVDDG